MSDLSEGSGRDIVWPVRRKGPDAFDWHDPEAKVWKSVPPLYSQEKEEDPLVRVKLFDPAGRFTLYVTEAGVSEASGRFTMFGYLVSPLGPDADELGYSDLEEVRDVRNHLGIGIERDLWFGERRLSEVKP